MPATASVPMSAARKEQRIDHIGIGGERQPVAMSREVRERDARLVLQRAEHGIVERSEEHVLDQRAHRLAAAAVRQVDARIAHRAAAPCTDQVPERSSGGVAPTSDMSVRP